MRMRSVEVQMAPQRCARRTAAACACSTSIGDGRKSGRTTDACRSVSTHHATEHERRHDEPRTARDRRGSGLRSDQSDSRLCAASSSGGSLTGCSLGAAAASTTAPAGDRWPSTEPALLRVQDDLDVGAPVLLAAGLGGVVGDRIVRAVADRLEARVGDVGKCFDEVFLARRRRASATASCSASASPWRRCCPRCAGTCCRTRSSCRRASRA